MEDINILCGDALEMVQQLEDGAIQMTVTSPPYYHLRRYTGDDAREIGREKTVQEYVAHLTDIFRALWDKTRDDGLLFLNLGDSYVNKELQGVPWRVALSISDNTPWIMRSDIIWRKTNAMPSAVNTRPTVEHEYVFMFSKNKTYYYDADAIREPHITFTEKSKMRGGRGHFGKRGGTPEQGKNAGNPNLHKARWDQAFNPKGRNKRTVWDIPLGKCREAHFAVFPEKLVETCMLAGSKSGDLVCDVFAGSGTTGIVATKLGREFVGIELNPEYVKMATRRISETQPQLLVESEMPQE